MLSQYKFLSPKIPDNDQSYFSLLEGVIEGVDAGCQLCVTHSPDKYHFRLVPSDAMLINSLIHAINELNTLMGIELQYSKSIKSTTAISFYLLTKP